jgi:uncharacterized repeat protein (TIGR03803 family)
MRMKIFASILTVALALNATNSPAQVYHALHNFGSQYRDGIGPSTDLVLNSNTLYGTTVSGGTNNSGTIFKINTDGNGYGILLSLTNSPSPEGGMVLIGNMLYGTTFTGGTNNNGSIFKINTDGSGFTELHSFAATVPEVWGTNFDGNRPHGDLVTDGNTLYGTAQYGGTNGNGTIFKINTDGMGFEVIKTFSATFIGTNNVSGNPLASGTNTDGARPIGGLVLDGSALYGTTYHGGTSNGVVFAVQTDGSDFTVLKYFSGISGIGTNSDGAAPVAALTLGGDTLYGVTVGGGSGASGNIFSLKTNGASFANLHDFSYHSDGGLPHITLLLDGGMLYGTTAAGGVSNKGTLFMVLTNGANFTILNNFDPIAAWQSDSKFVLSSNVLYGTADGGGSNNGGVVFGLTVLPQILSDGRFGIQSSAFGFDYTGISNQTAIIEFSTNLSQPGWLPLQTNVLTGAPLYFSVTYSSQNTNAFYRIQSP